MLKANINPFQSSVVFHVETSHLFCRAKQMTGFYMKRNTGLECVKYTGVTFLTPVQCLCCLLQTFFDSFLSTLKMYFPHGITIFPCNQQQKHFRKFPRMHVSKMHVSSLQAFKQKDCACFFLENFKKCLLLQN